MAGAKTLDALAKSCHEFANAQVAIKINGSALDEQYRPNDITIELPAAYQSGICRFTLEDAFVYSKDRTKVELDSALQDSIQLGSKVEVLLGYGDKAKTSVFIGYIDATYADYENDRGIVYTVECLDAKGIMMNSVHSEKKTSFKKYSEAAEDVLKKYTPLIAQTDVDSSDDEAGAPIEQHNESDYDFVVRLARKLNYYFYLVGAKAVFKKRTGLDNSIAMSYVIGSYVQAFKMQISLKDKVSKVTVRANDEKNPKQSIESSADSYKKLTADGSAQTSAFSAILKARVSRVVTDPSVGSETEAKARAESILYELYAGLMAGYIKTPGIPALMPGEVVSVAGFGTMYDKNYFVRRVIHTIKDNVFTTQCDLEANHL